MAFAYDYKPDEADKDAVIVEVAVADNEPQYHEDTGTLQVPLSDGSVEISFGPPSLVRQRDSAHFDDNLAEDLSESELGVICERLLQGIEQDLQSRQEWVENMQSGLALLGLQVKNPRGAAASGATPAEGTSQVDHPMLLEACLRFQANARGELLPADGPVKVKNDGEGNAIDDRLAEALEKDLNHFLLRVASEYVPDTDRMLLMTGFSGIGFKKGYHDPIKQRPVIASINAEDLIVSNAATDLEGAGRITHRIMMKPSMMRRMQLVGAYRDIHLAEVSQTLQTDPVKTKINQIQGIAPAAYINHEDLDRELYECYCEIEIPGFEHRLDGKDTGLPLPYVVTIDRESRRILAIRRNWEREDPFCLPRNRIIAYIFIPGLGFYGIGLLNILGNATKAMTAAWRLMIDAGMFNNFPGFLYLKSMARQMTNQFRIPPGGGMGIDGQGGQDIRQMVMPLPYKDPSPTFIQLMEQVSQTAQRVGGTAEMSVGEGKQDAPVGSTLAMIEQATKMMSAVHKRLHQAQGQEFDMLKSLLKEDPEALWRHNKKSQVLQHLVAMAGQQVVTDYMEAAEDRHRAMFLLALENCELVPAADPNTSTQTERYMKVVAARQMAQTNPQIDMNAVDRKAFETMGWDDADSYFKPPPPPGMPPSPEEMTAQATLMAAQARMQDSQTKQQVAQIKAQSDAQKMVAQKQIEGQRIAKELVIHNDDAAAAREEAGLSRAHDMRMAQSDQAHQRQMAGLGAFHDQMAAGADRSHQLSMLNRRSAIDNAQALAGHAHEAAMGGRQMLHDAWQAHQDRAHEHWMAHGERMHDHLMAHHERMHEAGMAQQEAAGGAVEHAKQTHEARHEQQMVGLQAAADHSLEARKHAFELAKQAHEHAHEHEIMAREHEQERARMQQEQAYAASEAAAQRQHEKSMPKPKPAAEKRWMGGAVELPAGLDNPPVHDVNAINALTEAVTALIKLQSAPRVIERDAAGRITGARIDTKKAVGPNQVQVDVDAGVEGIVTVHLPD